MLSISDDQFILYFLKPGDSEYVIISINHSLHGINHTKIINKNNVEDDNCASHHNLTTYCLLGNVAGSESDCAQDQTTDKIRKHLTKFGQGNRTDNEISIITNRSNNYELISTESPHPNQRCNLKLKPHNYNTHDVRSCNCCIDAPSDIQTVYMSCSGY